MLKVLRHGKKLSTMIPSWKQVVAAGGSPSHYIWSTSIEQSPQDDRSYRLIKLENGLQALIIHDGKADKSAASMDVGVGHLSDPDDMPGLAHFCEHLLFLGTEQFPRDNDYSEYITSNGGSTNAYTSTCNTNYYFNVSSSALLGAIPRFASFFHSPLFTPGCTTRELNAVDSEHKKNSQSDAWRIFQLNKSLSKPGHVWSKFGSGNRQSLTEVGRNLKSRRAQFVSTDGAETASQSRLSPSPRPSRMPSPAPSESSDMDADGGSSGRETRRRLVEWWEHNYCATRMKLAVLGKESLDELTAQVVEHFSPIQNRGLESLPMFPDSPWGPNEKGTIVFTKTVMDFRALEITTSIPWQIPNYTVKPANFLSHLVGHEGPGSIHSYLKNKGWIVSLSAGPSNAARGFAFFKVTIVMTKEGLDHYQEILKAVFSYLALLRFSPLPPSHQDEIRIRSETKFRFKEKSSPADYVSGLAQKLQDPYPRDRIITGPSLVWDWDENLVRTLLADLTAENSKIFVMAKDLESIAPSGDWLKERWYGTEYKVDRLDSALIEAREPNNIPELFLPGPNAFLPTDLSVAEKPVDQPLKRPLLIKETPLSTLWYKKDDQFWVPKGSFTMEITSPLAAVTPLNAVKTRLFADLITDALTEISYDADLAGLRYSIEGHSSGMSIAVAGYNDKLHILLGTVVEKLKGLEVKDDRLAVMKDQLKLELENFPLSQPYEISDYHARYFTTQTIWTPAEKLAEIPGITSDSMHIHVKDLLSRVHLKVLVHGNFLKDDAINMVTQVENTLNAHPLSPSEYIGERTLLLPPGHNYIYQDVVPNKKDVNSALSYYIQVGDIADRESRAIFGLLDQMIREPTFNVLRTKEQLGYIVSSSRWQSTGSMGLRVLVQSERKPDYLETRVEAFFDHYRSVLETMSDEEFEQQKKSFIDKLLIKLKNVGEESSRFWTHIESGYNEFTRREIDAAILQGVTRELVLRYFMDHIHPNSANRRKLSVHLRSEAPSKAEAISFSVAAANALLPELQARSIPVLVDQYHQQSALEPPVENVRAFWGGYIGSLPGLKDGVKAEILELVDKLAKAYPAEGDPVADIGEIKLKEGSEYIRDVVAFKAGLTLSKAATPMKDFSDLSTAKL